MSCGSASGDAEGRGFFRVVVFSFGDDPRGSSAAVATTDAGDVTLAPQMEQYRAVSGSAARHRAHATPGAPRPSEDEASPTPAPRDSAA